MRKCIISPARETLNFNTNWLYNNADYVNGEAVEFDESQFISTSVPHANTILKSHKGDDFPKQIASYRFVSWYRRHFILPETYAGKRILVEFEGVATIADVYVNGDHVGVHEGAYTGFILDITDYVYADGRDNVMAVRVNSEKQTQIPPEGGSVDYCLFGGIVRDVSMIIVNPVYVGGTFSTTPDLENGRATVHNVVEIKSEQKESSTYLVETKVIDHEDKIVATASEQATVQGIGTWTLEMETNGIAGYHLWSVNDPYLYKVITTISAGGVELDTYSSRLGLRYFEFKTGPEDGSLYVNGEKTELVGINRHEQWPWIGRAVPAKLQRRDADQIKASGINAVRCSHYPQHPSFLDRCDEIGLLLFCEPPGWQHIGNKKWQEKFKINLTEMILRDRNHPSIISWGARPNESRPHLAFNRECEQLAKELDPTRLTHGVRVEYDLPGEKNNYYKDNLEVVNDILTVNYKYPENPPHIPYIVTEHSNDWWGDGIPGTSDANAIKFIDSFAKVLDYYYGNDKVAGGFGWSMYDYNNEVNYTKTGHLFYSGLYDLFRHDKPVAHLYKSQMDPEKSGPMVYIANNWTKSTSKDIWVMSNCEEIELFVNGISKGRITPNQYLHMPHPVYKFKNVSYEEGELKAVGYINGRPVTSCVRETPGEAVKLIAEADYGILTADGTDMTSVTVTAVDANGNRVPFADNRIQVRQVDGTDTTWIAEDSVALEGGRMAFFVQSVHNKTGTADFEVTSPGMETAKLCIYIEPFRAGNLVPVAAGR